MITSMDQFLAHTIQNLYSAERQALKAMPQLVQHMQSQTARQAMEVHQRETEGQLVRLEQIAKQLGIDPQGQTCLGMEGLIEETQDLLAQLEPGELADAALIGAAQKMEHYEMASYGTARTLAQQTGQSQIANLLDTTLREEKAANQKLTYIATHWVNQQALEV